VPAVVYGHMGGKHLKRPTPPGPIGHGTSAGARAHRRRGEEPCTACKSAWAKYIRTYRKANKA
jgi:hypothetical protein